MEDIKASLIPQQNKGSNFKSKLMNQWPSLPVAPSLLALNTSLRMFVNQWLEIPRAQPEGFLEGSGYISPYILTFSISKRFTSSIVLPGWEILEELILVLVWQLGLYFPILPSR